MSRIARQSASIGPSTSGEIRVAARRRHVPLLDHVALALAARAPQESPFGEETHVVVDALSRQPKPPGDLRGRGRLPGEPQNPNAEGMKEDLRSLAVGDAFEIADRKPLSKDFNILSRQGIFVHRTRRILSPVPQ